MLRQRVITALVLAPFVLLVILWVPHPVTVAVLAMLVAAGAWEWSAFPGFTHQLTRFGYVAFIAACVALAWYAGAESARTDLVLDAALVWWVVALLWMAFAPGKVNRATAGDRRRVRAGAGMGGAGALARPIGVGAAIDVVSVAAGGGRRHWRIFRRPRVRQAQARAQGQPGQDLGGVGGGLLAAALMAAVGVWWFSMDTVPFMVLCIVVAIASVVGDLTESMFKRHAGLKDSGSLLPGHGGVLDRVDSVTAAAPVFVLGLERLGLLR